MKVNRLKGLGVAMVTPFDANGGIDFEALKKLTTFLIDGQADYLVVQGTTGESPVLSKSEKQEVLNTVCEVNNGRLPVIFGIGGNSTQSVVNDLKTFDLSKVDGILSASPYYNKPTQEGIYLHFKTIADATDLPVILYNVPGRTASNMLPETTLRLANDCSNIVAIKEASGDIEQIMEIIRQKPGNFLVISGDDAITLPLIAAGGDGIISVIGNGFPAPFKAMVTAAMQGDLATARKLHYLMLPMVPALFAEGNPAAIKEVLQFKGIMENHLRLPLVNVSDALRTKLKKMTEDIDNV